MSKLPQIDETQPTSELYIEATHPAHLSIIPRVHPDSPCHIEAKQFPMAPQLPPMQWPDASLQPPRASPQSGQPFRHPVSALQSEPKQPPTAFQHVATKPLRAPQSEHVQCMTPDQQEVAQLPNALNVTPQQCPILPKDTFNKPAVMTLPAAATDFDHEDDTLTMPLGVPVEPRRRPSLA